jgi:hypothetical protein
VVVRDVGEGGARQELEDALVAWEGVTLMLGVGLTSGNTYVVRAAVQAVTVPMARAAERWAVEEWILESSQETFVSNSGE